jgi:hypothetical protein
MAETHRDYIPPRDADPENPAVLEQPARWADEETLARLQAYPCLRCLSDKELWVATVMLLCTILEADIEANCSTEVLMENAACADCFSDRQMWQVLLALIGQWAVDNGYVDSIGTWLQQGSCLTCLSEKKLKAMVVALLARGLAAGTLFPAQQ